MCLKKGLAACNTAGGKNTRYFLVLPLTWSADCAIVVAVALMLQTAEMKSNISVGYVITTRRSARRQRKVTIFPAAAQAGEQSLSSLTFVSSFSIFWAAMAAQTKTTAATRKEAENIRHVKLFFTTLLLLTTSLSLLQATIVRPEVMHGFFPHLRGNIVFLN